MPSVETDEFSVYYESQGEGDPLVLIHGGGGNHAAWFQQVPHFRERYQVITLDLPGFGLSKIKSGRYDMDSHPEAIRAVLDDTGVGPAFLVTQSLGGYGGLTVAVNDTERIVGIVMASTLGPIGDEVNELHQQGRARVQHMGVAEFLLTEEFREANPDKVELFLQLGSFNETGPGRPNRLKATLAGTVSIQQMRDAIAEGVSITVLEGGRDIMVVPPAYARLRELLPEANIEQVDGAPHSDYWENPARFNAVVDASLERAKEATRA